MDRKEFLSSLGISATSLLLASCLGSCSKQSSNSTSNPVDFTLDITQYPALSSAGGFIYKNGVIIAKTSTGTLIAVAQACTHEGYDVQFEVGNNDFRCPRHGARFSTTGSVLQGPANYPLKQFTVTESGNSIRIQG